MKGMLLDGMDDKKRYNEYENDLHRKRIEDEKRLIAENANKHHLENLVWQNKVNA